MPQDLESLSPLEVAQRTERRLAALEAETAVFKAAMHLVLGGQRPAYGTANPFHLQSLEGAQAVWDELFGADGGADGGGEGGG